MAQGFTAAPAPNGCAFHPQEVLLFYEGTQGRGFGGGAFPVHTHLKASGEKALKLVWRGEVGVKMGFVSVGGGGGGGERGLVGAWESMEGQC